MDYLVSKKAHEAFNWQVSSLVQDLEKLLSKIAGDIAV